MDRNAVRVRNEVHFQQYVLAGIYKETLPTLSRSMFKDSLATNKQKPNASVSLLEQSTMPYAKMATIGWQLKRMTEIKLHCSSITTVHLHISARENEEVSIYSCEWDRVELRQSEDNSRTQEHQEMGEWEGGLCLLELAGESLMMTKAKVCSRQRSVVKW